MKKFKVSYWGKNKSTKVKFQPPSAVLEDIAVTSCFCFGLVDNKLLMVSGKRGFSLPGGHLENDETPEQCLRREVKEEACATLGEYELVGGWLAEKVKNIEENSRYPDKAYQLLFISKEIELEEFNPEFETSRRALIKLEDVKDTHHNFEYFSDVYEYTIKTFKL